MAGSTLYTGSQCGHVVRAVVAGCLGIEQADLRVVVPDMGGGFGARNLVYPDLVVIPFAARALGRPVRWIASRSEAFLTDTQARSQHLRARMALDAGGGITAIDVKADWWHGAHLLNRTPQMIVTWMSPMICGPYRIPAHRFEIAGVFTNTAPIAAFRGVARAEATLALERLIDAAARETGIGRVELRRRNLIALADMPWQSPTGARYQRNDFFGSLAAGLDRIGWSGFAARRAASAAQGLRRGRSVTTYVENAGGALSEFVDLRIERPNRMANRWRAGRPGPGARRQPGLRHGPRHRVRPDPRRPAGRGAGAGDRRGRRHRPDRGRRRLPRLAHHAHRRRRGP